MPDITEAYKEALNLLNLSDFSRETGRALRTIQGYRRGDWKPSDAAVREIIEYLRERADSLSNAADELAALREEEGNA